MSQFWMLSSPFAPPPPPPLLSAVVWLMTLITVTISPLPIPCPKWANDSAKSVTTPLHADGRWGEAWGATFCDHLNLNYPPELLNKIINSSGWKTSQVNALYTPTEQKTIQRSSLSLAVFLFFLYWWGWGGAVHKLRSMWNVCTTCEGHCFNYWVSSGNHCCWMCTNQKDSEGSVTSDCEKLFEWKHNSSR